MLEFDNTAAGYFALDVLVKAAPVEIIRVTTINPGKLLLFFTGDVASVEAAAGAGSAVRREALVDRLFLPWVHENLVSALAAGDGSEKRAVPVGDSVAIIDIASVATGIESADRAVKETAVSIYALRFDDAMGGRVSLRFTGDLHEVEAAVETVLSRAGDAVVHHSIIANPHPEMLSSLDGEGGIP